MSDSVVVYEPREDSELLCRYLMDHPRKGAALDLCTGTGIQAIALAKSARSVLAVDIQQEAVFCARERVKLAGLENVQVIQNDLFSGLPRGFGRIVCNPPYLPSGSILEEDRAWAGGWMGRRIIDRILLEFPPYLIGGGELILLQSSLNGLQETRRLLPSGFRLDVVAEEKVPWEVLSIIRIIRN